ncbi:MAG: tyrosine-type recombinase/integrase [Firmicutes bacterium]|nr:tyrosine-type recombinase/integrase [Bacillota bacterium]
MKITINSSLTTFKLLFNDFLTSCKAKGLSEKTLQSYASHLKCFGKYLDLDTPIEDLTQKHIEEMVNKMRDKGLSPNTIQSYLRTMASFFSWCRRNGLYTPHIAQYRGVEVIKDTYTDEELKRLLKKPNLKECSFSEYRNWVIINLFLDCGCRSATIRAIEIRDVDLVKGMVAYRHTKSRKVQILPLSSMMVSILQEYLRIRRGNPEDKLFCSIEGEPMTESCLKSAIRDYNLRRGVRKTSCHLFRHSYAKRFLLDCGGDAFALQHILGHSTLAMTKHYCNIYDADLLNNYNELSPLAKLSGVGSIKKADIQKRR